MSTPSYLQRLGNARAALRRQRALRARDGWTPEQLAAHQRERLSDLVRHAVAESPLYRERFAGIDTGGEVELEALPPVTKAELMERFDDWVCDRRLRRDDLERHVAALEGDALYLDEFRVMATGGTTGRRGVFLFDRKEWSELCALMLRGLQSQGMKPSIPRRRLATVLAPSAAHMTWRISASMDFGLYRLLRMPVTAPMAELVRELNAFRPFSLGSYPSMAALLAEEQLEGRLRIQPTVVATSSEVCTEEMRARIREAWGVDPHEVYGATDGLWGFTCPERHAMHFCEDETIVEVEDGRILITNLFMRTQPVIRYEITDLVRIDPEPCGCGRPYRTVAAIEGRSDDILRFPGGAVVHPIKLRSPMAKLAGVRQYQIVHRADGLHVRVVPRNGDCSHEVERAISGALAEVGAGSVPVHVELADAIERDTTGVAKMKLVRSEL